MAKLIDFNIASVEFQSNPYPYYARLHGEDAIFHDRRVGAYFIGKYVDPCGRFWQVQISRQHRCSRELSPSWGTGYWRK